MFKKIGCVALAALLIVSLFPSYGTQSASAAEAPATLIITDTGYTIDGLALEFSQAGEQNEPYAFTIKTTSVDDNVIPIYLLDDPMSVGSSVNAGAISSSFDSRTIEAILALSKRNTVNQLNSELGITATNHEYIAGTNIAIWKAIASASQFKLDGSTVTNTKVNAIADWFLEKAAASLSTIGSTDDVMNSIIGVPTLKLDSSAAVANVSNQYNYYGPYKFTVSGTNNPIKLSSSGDYIITTSVGGDSVDKVDKDQNFYIRFDKALTTDLRLDFTLDYSGYTMGQYENVVAVLSQGQTLPIQLNISNSTATGNITYTKTDAVSKAPIPGVTVQVLNSGGSVITQMVTNAQGVATSPDIPLGSYTVKESATVAGYELDSVTQVADISTNGQTVALVSKGVQVEGNTTFIVVNANTGGAVVGSKFDLFTPEGIRKATVVTDNNGECSNVKVDPGSYYLKETASATNYQWIVEKIPFTIAANKENVVEIKKIPAFSGFEAKVLDSAGKIVGGATVTVYDSSSNVITTLTANSSGIVNLAVPAGTYYLKQTSTTTNKTYKTYPVTVPNTSEYAKVTLGELPETTVAVVGVVKNTDGTPIQGVTLKLVDEDGEEYGRTTTNYAGKYEIEDVPASTPMWFKVTKAPDGYSGDIGTVKIITKEDSDTTKDLTIKRTSESDVVAGEGTTSVFDPNAIASPTTLSSNPDTLSSGTAPFSAGTETLDGAPQLGEANSSDAPFQSTADDAPDVGPITDSSGDDVSDNPFENAPSQIVDTDDTGSSTSTSTSGGVKGSAPASSGALPKTSDNGFPAIVMGCLLALAVSGGLLWRKASKMA